MEPTTQTGARYAAEFRAQIPNFVEMPGDQDRFQAVLDQSRLSEAFAYPACFVQEVHAPFAATGAEVWPFQLQVRLFSPGLMAPALCFLIRKTGLQETANDRKTFRSSRGMRRSDRLILAAAAASPALIYALLWRAGLYGPRDIASSMAWIYGLGSLAAILSYADLRRWARPRTQGPPSRPGQLPALDRLLADAPTLSKICLALEGSNAFLLLQFQSRTGLFGGRARWIDQGETPAEFAEEMEALRAAIGYLATVK